jgi:UDP-N-acetylglucosamine--N-acetylmuramyl-(pentapeptide) pyrophosphoryl-undecaprenol N-acetylglucosamine transferase
MSKPKTFLIMAGGTGGHVFPALATARLLESHQHQVHWLGTVGGMETKWVSEAGIAISSISIKGIRGKGIATLLKAPFHILRSLMQAIRVIQKVKPDCVLGMGGFVTGPGGVAAKLMGKPLIIHEQNAVAGLTNRLLARIADVVLEAFPASFPKNIETHLTGNPVREEMVEWCREQSKKTPENQNAKATNGRINLLVVGGSLGAVSINKVVPAAIKLMPESLRPNLKHQTGQNNLDQTREEYSKNELLTTYVNSLVPFIRNMHEAYRWADVVICRAGALTIAELCMSGVGALLVPFPAAVDDHQTRNANYMVQGQAAELMPQQHLTADVLAAKLIDLFSHPARLETMATNAAKLAMPEATERVVNYCEEACHA